MLLICADGGDVDAGWVVYKSKLIEALGLEKGGTVWRGKCRGSAGCRVRKGRPISTFKVPFGIARDCGGKDCPNQASGRCRVLSPKLGKDPFLFGEHQQEQSYR